MTTKDTQEAGSQDTGRLVHGIIKNPRVPSLSDFDAQIDPAQQQPKPTRIEGAIAVLLMNNQMCPNQIDFSLSRKYSRPANKKVKCRTQPYPWAEQNESTDHWTGLEMRVRQSFCRKKKHKDHEIKVFLSLRQVSLGGSEKPKSAVRCEFVTRFD
jgi:hypothetical protein